MILPAQADTNGCFVYEVCQLSSYESAKAELPECQTSMSPFLVFCADFDSDICILVTFITRKRYQVTKVISCCIS